MIAVCLLTCERLAYTAVTLRSFAAFNDTSRFMLLHGDDASTDPAVRALPRTFGFTTVFQTEARIGWLAMRTRLFQVAARRGARWVLFLENDIEWVRAFPWALFEFVNRHSQLYCLRLQGKFKGKNETEPCMIYDKRDRRKPVRWGRLKYAPEPAQVGYIHWSAQPSVTRIHELLNLHEYGMESPDRTVRVVENVTYHIGATRTRELEAATC